MPTFLLIYAVLIRFPHEAMVFKFAFFWFGGWYSQNGKETHYTIKSILCLLVFVRTGTNTR
jgi:hypothetical protein